MYLNKFFNRFFVAIFFVLMLGALAGEIFGQKHGADGLNATKDEIKQMFGSPTSYMKEGAIWIYSHSGGGTNTGKSISTGYIFYGNTCIKVVTQWRYSSLDAAKAAMRDLATMGDILKDTGLEMIVVANSTFVFELKIAPGNAGTYLLASGASYVK